MERKDAEKKVDELLSRGAESFIDPENSFKNKLISKLTGEYTKDIFIKFGVDPTRPDIHLGHAVVLKSLRAFQDIGCKVIFLIGDFTGTIGDPTGKSKVRPEIDQSEIEHNMKTYLDQVGKILKTDEKVFTWMRNSDWFVSPFDLKTEGMDSKVNDVSIDPNSTIGKAIIYEGTRMQVTHLKHKKVESVSFSNILWTLRHITHARLIERDMFQERLTKGESLYMHEMLYPVMQGIDSVILSKIYGSCDMEVGGNDQTFNMLMGRDIMRLNKMEEQAVMSFNILRGTDGKEKMSKSLDNYIAITDEPHDMYGKVMSIPDHVMKEYFTLCTYTPLDEIEKMIEDSESGKVNPKDIKKRLAEEIVTIYHGSTASAAAEEAFENTFSKGGTPEDMKEIVVTKESALGDVLAEAGIVSSKTEWRRLVNDNAITNLDSGEKITDPASTVSADISLKVGKYRFVKIKIGS
ncbi:MAG: tyrosine--tRNA ligase [Candidatus Zambryskibacteria bacterium CG10_big_fil_rev_8_21_14_0_10_42_12]|uniref:Tyrosine--tRNA ligase n=1 Tax=Candidatus Zambryskibacteria bacterium CG10_big_fil_rev_8_21_14_0_10_42_12 TaxID=1975115 RepID=A0A2H0QSG5_9BACT|nr:MAG: tyrosine--tRNA ligase [Candidatus Zambryskibacteria bacterium CG10_big_fil_rev_8_21_14_0_10_42_12]